MRKDEIFYAKAEGVGNPVFYVGAKTGRDGIHGATMASEEFTEGSEQKRPNVQMGDPFLEKLLLEACLEVMKTGAVLGIQDMGAAGLTCSTCEMGARGSLGVTIELDRVPQRETGMTTYEIMLSESQERMLLVAEKGREAEVLAVFEKWGLDCAEVGTVTADDVMRVFHGGVLEAEIPNKALTDEAPVYHRPVGTWNPPVPRDPPPHILEALKQPRDYTADLKALLASPNICSKHWIYEQYDSMVQTNTVQGPGGEAGVIRIKGTGFKPATNPGAPGLAPETWVGALSPLAEAGVMKGTTSAVPQATQSAGASAPEAMPAGEHPTPHHAGFLGGLIDVIASSTPKGEATLSTGNEDAANPVVLPGSNHESALPLTTDHLPLASKPERGLAMALAGNGRWCYLDPKLGAMHAVAEAARKVACTGATPVAATNCLNFGNPQKPEIMAQLSAAIDGIAEACTALGTPITGGNVSLYNETLGEGIYPTPVIGVVGILDDVTKAVPAAFQHLGDTILGIFPLPPAVHPPGWEKRYDDWLHTIGTGEYAQVIHGAIWGSVPDLNVQQSALVNKLLIKLASLRLLKSAADDGSGGTAVTVAKCGMLNNIGAAIAVIDEQPSPTEHASLYLERPGSIIATCRPEDTDRILEIARQDGVGCWPLGVTIADELRCDDIGRSDPSLVWSLGELRAAYTNALESQLAEEVHA